MPLYEFRCPDGHDFEKFYRSISAAPPTENCPVCGKAAERLMSAAGLVFKGSGFYITDYGKDGKKAEREAATAAKSSETRTESNTEGKAESKTESKTEKTETAKADSPSPAPKAEAKPAATKPAASSSNKAE